MLVMVVLDSVIDAQCSHHIKDKMDAYDQLIANGLSQQVTASHTVNFVSQMQSQKSARHRGWLCAPICKSQYNCLSYYYIITTFEITWTIHSFFHSFSTFYHRIIVFVAVRLVLLLISLFIVHSGYLRVIFVASETFANGQASLWVFVVFVIFFNFFCDELLSLPA
jgi:hypothetical protein